MADLLKSAQALSLNTIIIAVIVLVVLMVTIGIFGGYFNAFGPDFKAASEKECTGEGYKTLPECGELNNFDYKQVYANFAEGVIPEGEVCCKSSCKALKDGKCEGEGYTLVGNEKFAPEGNTGCSGDLICVKTI